MRLEEPDRIPILNWNAWCANLIGVKTSEIHQKAETWVKAQLTSLEKFDTDCLMGLSDAALEAQAMGAIAKIPEWNIPYSEPIVRNAEDVDKLEVPDPKKDGRLPVALKAVEILSKEAKGKIYVSGNACAPFTMAGILIGAEQLAYSLVKDLDFVKKCMDFSLRHAKVWIKAQVDAGADQIITWDPFGSGDLFSVKHYKELVLPYAKKISEIIKRFGGKYAHHYHICGDTNDRLSEIGEVGASIVSLDEKDDMNLVKKTLGVKTCLAGNVKTNTLLMGTPEQVELDTRECVKKAARGGGYVIWPGCDVPLDSPVKNVEAMVKVGREHTYPICFH